jgi:nicotinamide riboside kinase
VCDPEILNVMSRRHYDHYLLTDIDMPWVDDPLREHPDKREELFALYFEALRQQQVSFTVIRGVGEARTRQAISVIDGLLSN